MASVASHLPDCTFLHCMDRQREYLVSGGGYLAFGLTYLAYFTVYILRKPISVAKPLLQQELGWTTMELGYLDTAFLLMYSMTQFYFGYLGDVYLPRIVLVLSITGSALTLWYCQWLSSILPFVVLCALQGAFQGIVWPTVVKAVDPWINPDHRGTVMIWWGSHQALGGVVGTLLAVYLVTNSGERAWRGGFTAPSLIGLAVAVLLYALLPDWKRTKQNGEQEGNEETMRSFNSGKERHATSTSAEANLSFGNILKMPGVWNASSSFFLVKCIKYVLLMWLPMLFVQLLGYDLTTAGALASLYDLGNAVASPACGTLGGLLGGDVAKMCFWLEIGFVGSLGLFLALGGSSPAIAGVCVVLFGVCCGGADLLLSGPIAAIIGADVSARFNRPMQGTVVGVICGVGSVGAVLQGFLVGGLTDIVGWNGCLFVLAALAAMAAALVHPLIGSQSPKSQRDNEVV